MKTQALSTTVNLNQCKNILVEAVIYFLFNFETILLQSNKDNVFGTFFMPPLIVK